MSSTSTLIVSLKVKAKVTLRLTVYRQSVRLGRLGVKFPEVRMLYAEVGCHVYQDRMM
jgi:hypothetical protein